MIKGLYSAASAMLASMHQQSALSHNVSNLDTPGFKQVLVGLDDFIRQPVVYPLAQPNASNPLGRYLGTLGLGVESRPEETDFSEGPLKSTGEPFDVAINGAGFFKVELPGGEQGYTRDGRFLLDAEGSLVTVDGYKVLDDGDQPITIEEGEEFAISGEGVIFVDGEELAALGVHSFNDPKASLERLTPNVYHAAGEPEDENIGTVVQGHLEMANANAAGIMTQMVMVARQYEAAQQMVQNQDSLLGAAINSLGSL